MNNLTISGMPVVESLMCQDVSKFTLSPEVPVTPEFRADFDRWARAFFGVHDVAYTMRDQLTGHQMIVASPRAVAQMRAIKARTSPF